MANGVHGGTLGAHTSRRPIASASSEWDFRPTPTVGSPAWEWGWGWGGRGWRGGEKVAYVRMLRLAHWRTFFPYPITVRLITTFIPSSFHLSHLRAVNLTWLEICFHDTWLVRVLCCCCVCRARACRASCAEFVVSFALRTFAHADAVCTCRCTECVCVHCGGL